ncbi:MAG: hypothetical protein HUK20_04480 [Fibrobacter sp.]|nr:hypothetical protein [Fibrobacter sp.]
MINKLAVVAFTLLVGGSSVFAENILTYTATSKVSQKDADQAALAGVAKQVQTQVKAEFETRKNENAQGEISETAQSFKGTYTDVVLKGVKITVGEKEKGVYKSTATLDLDQLTSKMVADLEMIRGDMKKLDSLIRAELQNADYRSVSMNLSELEKLADKYNDVLEELSMFRMISRDLLLESTLGELMDFFAKALESVKIETDLSSEALTITVSDVMGPVANFPIAVLQDRRELLQSKTDENGELVFPLDNVRAKKASGQVTVVANLSFKYMHKAAVESRVVEYSAEMSSCGYRLTCSGSTADCGTLHKVLSDGGLSLLDKAGLPELKVNMSFADKVSGNGSLYTSKATLVFSYDDVKMTEQPQGIGRDAGAAHEKAIAKMNAAKVVKAFGKKCKSK